MAPLTVLTVWFVLMLGVSQGQGWVRAAGQAGVAARLHTPAPEAHGTFRWHHPLILSVHIWACANGVATVGKAHLCTEGQATACGWFTYSQLPQVEVLSCKRKREHTENITTQATIYKLHMRVKICIGKNLEHTVVAALNLSSMKEWVILFVFQSEWVKSKYTILFDSLKALILLFKIAETNWS